MRKNGDCSLKYKKREVTKMKGITAEQAREIAVGAESIEVQSAMANIENRIHQEAVKGELRTTISMAHRSYPVNDKCSNLLKERGFKVCVNGARLMSIEW
jgi:hypothetical protein